MSVNLNAQNYSVEIYGENPYFTEKTARSANFLSKLQTTEKKFYSIGPGCNAVPLRVEEKPLPFLGNEQGRTKLNKLLAYYGR